MRLGLERQLCLAGTVSERRTKLDCLQGKRFAGQCKCAGKICRRFSVGELKSMGADRFGKICQSSTTRKRGDRPASIDFHMGIKIAGDFSVANRKIVKLAFDRHVGLLTFRRVELGVKSH